MSDESADVRLTAFGVDAETGEVGSIGLDEVRRIVAGWDLDADRSKGHRFGMNPEKLSSSGWGIVVPRDRRDELLSLLDPLLAHRRKQVRRKHRFRVLEYLPGKEKDKFLEDNGADIDIVDPDRLPYYLLIVGTPREIPWDFQYQLDVQYAVGRIGFDDPNDYRRYAAAVVAAEVAPARARRTLLFGPRHPGDRATTLASEHLIDGLAKLLEKSQRRRRRWRWGVQVETAEAATRRRLIDHLGSADGPALLMTVGHGLLLRRDHPERRARQGALVCQDWPGGDGVVPEPEHVVAAADLGSAARPAGLIAFCFACHSAGTPAYDDYADRRDGADPAGPIARRPIAEHDFTASLPQRLLAQGALAVVGHVERAWIQSFMGPKESRIVSYESVLSMLMDGQRVGHAMDPLNLRGTEMAFDLVRVWRQVREGEKVDLKKLIDLWTLHNDARGWVVLGDPAVRVAVEKAG